MENLENNELPSPQDLSASVLNLSSVKADEEDLTVVNQSGVDVLKFKDRAFDPAQFSGLGYKILRKRIIEGKNVLLQQDFVANSIHEIRYDFDLGGSTITFPKDVILNFKGGSLKNGTIVGNGTRITADTVKIFDLNLVFNGDFSIGQIYPEWFGADSIYANSNDNDTEAVSSPIYLVPSKVDTLQDSSSAFNSAFRLSIKSGGTVTCFSRFYKITQKIFMPMKSHLHLSANTVIFAYTSGRGLRLMEQNYHTSQITELPTNDTPIYIIKPNQFFHTDDLAVAIEMFPQQTKITGRGTLSLIKCRYTTGILIRGAGFHVLDMSYGSPEIDIRIIGDVGGTSSPDSHDMVGKEKPKITDNIPDNIYYWDKEGKNYYKKQGNTWSKIGNEGQADPKFNVLLRIDVGAGYASGRLINPQIKIWGMLGWRGIELYTHDGGFCNEGLWEGTISNLHGSFISIFSNYDVVGHDMGRLICQVDDRIQYDARILHIIRGNLYKTPKTWDMSWLQIKCEYAFYLGKFSENVQLESYDRYRYVLDEGDNNIIVDISTNERNPDLLAGKYLRNILKFRSPLTKNGGLSEWNSYYVELSKPISDPGQLVDVKNANLGTGKNIPKLFFDESSSYKTVIDVKNGKYGILFNLLNQASTITERLGNLKNGGLVIEYSWDDWIENAPTGDQYGKQEVFVIVRGSGSFWWNGDMHTLADSPTYGYRTYQIPIRESKFNNEAGWVNTTQKMYIPTEHQGWSASHNLIAIYAKQATGIAKLNIHNIQFLVDSYTIASDIESLQYGSTKNRPDACPKGHLYEDTTLGRTLINKGDSTTQNWVELPLEQAGNWTTITTGNSITAAVADYSKIGKQVYLAGQLSFSNSYVVNTNLPITLPFTPNYGGVFTVGDLTFTLSNNSTAAQVKSASTGNNKPFQLNFKTA
ncbi:MAG: hypothetical protein K0R59_50 [Sphingobacterium sp.]|nr:hypothetical protein [Sphingobacterium sp.]